MTEPIDAAVYALLIAQSEGITRIQSALDNAMHALTRSQDLLEAMEADADRWRQEALYWHGLATSANDHPN